MLRCRTSAPLTDKMCACPYTALMTQLMPRFEQSSTESRNRRTHLGITYHFKHAPTTRLLRASASSMANSVRVAVAQMTSANDIAANFSTCSRLVKEAAAAGAKFLCFPESFSYIGAGEGDSVKIAETLDGPIMKGYCALARESNIWLSLGGFQEKGSDDFHLCNTHVIVDDSGNIRSKYRKIHLFDVDVPGGMEQYIRRAALQKQR
ncbi:Deaminated glutathione amidase, chloroplastic/cytosolic [Ancistrocladus abbreviatus]